jgi:hypothetical protein
MFEVAPVGPQLVLHLLASGIHHHEDGLVGSEGFPGDVAGVDFLLDAMLEGDLCALLVDGEVQFQMRVDLVGSEGDEEVLHVESGHADELEGSSLVHLVVYALYHVANFAGGDHFVVLRGLSALHPCHKQQQEEDAEANFKFHFKKYL